MEMLLFACMEYGKKFDLQLKLQSPVRKLTILSRQLSSKLGSMASTNGSGGASPDGLGCSSCPNSPQVKKSYRLMILGSARTGKTCVVNRFLTGAFDDAYNPTIENFHRKMYKIHNDFYQLDIFDTAGNDPFPASKRLQILTGDLFLVVFSVDNQSSRDEALRLMDEIILIKTGNTPADKSTLASSKHQHQHPTAAKTRSAFSISVESSVNRGSRGSLKGKSGLPAILVAANKMDIPPNRRSVDDLDRMADFVATRPNCDFIECSAKTDDEINQAFHRLFQLGKLPKQMSPCYHRSITLERSLDSALPDNSQVQTQHKNTVSRLMSKFSDGTGPVIFDAEAKRPSLRTDLLSMNLIKQQQSMPAKNEHSSPTTSISSRGVAAKLVPKSHNTTSATHKHVSIDEKSVELQKMADDQNLHAAKNDSLEAKKTKDHKCLIM